MSGGALEASVTLDEVLTVVGARRVPLAPELAGYLVLEIAEHADPEGGDVDPKSVFVGEEGTVALVKPKRDVAHGDAEVSLRTALGRLLDASGSQTPALAAASRRRNGAGLPALAEELQAALIPVNRAAGRRALARLAREVKRVMLGVGRHTLPSSASARASAKEPASLPSNDPPSSRRPPPAASKFSPAEARTTTRSQIPSELLKPSTPATWYEMPTTEFAPDSRAASPSQTDVDDLIAQFGVSGGGEQQQARALRAMAGLDPTPPTPSAWPRRQGVAPTASASPQESDIEALLAMNREPPEAGGDAPMSGGSPVPARRAPDERQLPTQPSQRHRARASIPNGPRASPARGWVTWSALALVALAAGSYAVWQLRPAALSRRLPATAERPPVPPPHQGPVACAGTLVVADVPPHAEVLLHQGQAPVDVPRMPVGARLEFVATAEGYAPKRVVLPAGSPWDSGPDGRPRFEAAVQLDPSKARAGTNDPWPAGEPGSAVGGEGAPGTVHVVATPRGAEVWMLAGIGPEARIEHLRCDQDIDILLAGPTIYRKRLHVGANEFVPDDNPGVAKGPARIARVSAN